MAPSIRLGRLFGIEIGANWSLLFILAFFTWSLATSVFPSYVPGQPAGAYWITALVGALLFYAGLLAHEFSHALMARRQNVKVAGITLWLFGGVSRLEGQPQTPQAEALITVVGPLTSFAVAAVSFGLYRATMNDGLVGAMFGWLATVNVSLGLFNLVPAFPLDGGRLLSSLLWWRSGSRQQGVHNAARVGRVFAYLMIAGGVLELFLGDIVNGVWIAFLGWFLLSAASAEEAGSTVQTLLKSVPVSAAMTSPVVILPDWVTVEQFLESVAPNHPFTTYPVHDNSGKLTGVVRLGDLVRVPREARGQTHLIQVARPISEIPSTTPREDLAALIRRIGGNLDQRVLVFDGGQLVGILSAADVARMLAARQALASPAGQKPDAATRPEA